MKRLSTQEVRNLQLTILDEVHDFCEKNNIQYFLCGGTLIGAIRHQGYIPWDDDIDVALLRKDYERFLRDFNSYNDLYKVYEVRNSDWYPYPFAKVSYEKSVLIEANDNLSCNLGVNIDIFPIDNIPDDEKVCKKLLRKIRILRSILDIKAIKINQKRRLYKTIILRIGKFLFRNINPNTIAKKINSIAMKYENIETNKVGVIVWGYGQREIVEKLVFDEAIKTKFEGKEYRVPKLYDKWLTCIYGDYMKLPPIERRVSHHAFEAYLTETS